MWQVQKQTAANGQLTSFILKQYRVLRCESWFLLQMGVSPDGATCKTDGFSSVTLEENVKKGTKSKKDAATSGQFYTLPPGKSGRALTFPLYFLTFPGPVPM